MNIPAIWSFPIRAFIFLILEILLVAIITSDLINLDNSMVFYGFLLVVLVCVLGPRIGGHTIIAAGLCLPFALLAYGLLFPNPGSGFLVAFSIPFAGGLALLGAAISGLVLLLEKGNVLRAPSTTPPAAFLIIFAFLVDFVLFMTVEAFGGGYNGTSWF